MSPELIIAKQQAEHDALQKEHAKLATALQEMYTTLRTLTRNVDALRDRAGHALAAVRGFPESMHVDDIPDGCLGWGMCETDMTPCQQCPHKWDCFEAGH
jgi:NAD-dependent SIR2 family protein deacetylase